MSASHDPSFYIQTLGKSLCCFFPSKMEVAFCRRIKGQKTRLISYLLLKGPFLYSPVCLQKGKIQMGKICIFQMQPKKEQLFLSCICGKKCKCFYFSRNASSTHALAEWAAVARRGGCRGRTVLTTNQEPRSLCKVSASSDWLNVPLGRSLTGTSRKGRAFA